MRCGRLHDRASYMAAQTQKRVVRRMEPRELRGAQMNETPGHPMDVIREEAKSKLKKEKRPAVVLPDGVHLNDFVAYMPQHSYIFKPDGGMWPGSSVNARIPPIRPIGEKKEIPAAT